MLFRILAVGDVVGNPGLDFAAKNLRRIKKRSAPTSSSSTAKTQTSSA